MDGVPAFAVWKQQSARGVLHVHYAVDEPWWRDVAADFWAGRLASLERVPSSPHAEVDRGAIGPGSSLYYCKRFLMRGPMDSLKHLVRKSRAARAVYGATLLERAGFSSPRVVCKIEERRAGLVRRSGLITEAVTEAPALNEWIRDRNLSERAGWRRRRRLFRDFGAEVGRLHGAGIYHGDMRHGNVLCQPVDDGWRFVWLDLESTRGFQRIPFDRRVRNLAQLNLWPDDVTLGERWAFWLEYVEASKLAPAAAKQVLPRVIAETWKRWRQWGWEPGSFPPRERQRRSQSK